MTVIVTAIVNANANATVNVNANASVSVNASENEIVIAVVIVIVTASVSVSVNVNGNGNENGSENGNGKGTEITEKDRRVLNGARNASYKIDRSIIVAIHRERNEWNVMNGRRDQIPATVGPHENRRRHCAKTTHRTSCAIVVPG